MRTTCGSKVYEDFVPAMDAAMVERLRAAGACDVRQAQQRTTHGDGITSANPHFGPVRVYGIRNTASPRPSGERDRVRGDSPRN